MGQCFSGGSRRMPKGVNENLLPNPTDAHTSLSGLVSHRNSIRQQQQQKSSSGNNHSTDATSDFQMLLQFRQNRRLQQPQLSPNNNPNLQSRSGKVSSSDNTHNNTSQMMKQQNKKLVDLEDQPMISFVDQAAGQNGNNKTNLKSASNNNNSENIINNNDLLMSNLNQPIINPKVNANKSTSNTLSSLNQNNINKTDNANVGLKRLVIVMFDYVAQADDDLTIKKGELLELIKDANEHWSLAKSIETKKTGYIPKNFVADHNTVESEFWYFSKMQRVEAERRLLSAENMPGAFIVRESESKKNDFSLSVLDYDSVKHYRIRRNENGEFYIAKRAAFKTLQELVAHYGEKADGLCVNLRQPCARVDKPTATGLSYDTCDQWEIDRNTLTIIRTLGHGQFGQVYEGIWKSPKGNRKVAIKTLKSGFMDPADFLEEAQIMKKMIHENLVQLYAVCTREEPIFIVTELMPRGCLLNYLSTKEGLAIDDHKLINMGAQIANGMKFLEQNHYVHRDLAARNILVGDNNVVKIADFGLARLIKESEYEARAGARFPIKWTAPEAATRSIFSIKSDVWSFGIVLYEIITHGRVPYPTMTNADVLVQVEHGYRMPKPEECPNKLYSIMQECWHRDPNKRPTFDTLQWKLNDYYSAEDSEYRDAEQFRIR